MTEPIGHDAGMAKRRVRSSPDTDQSRDHPVADQPRSHTHSRRGPSILLAVVGVILLLVAIAALLLNKPEPLTGGFLVCGGALIVLGVLSMRMEGRQKFGLSGIDINLNKIAEAERQIQAGHLKPLEDVL